MDMVRAAKYTRTVNLCVHGFVHGFDIVLKRANHATLGRWTMPDVVHFVWSVRWVSRIRHADRADSWNVAVFRTLEVSIAPKI